MDKDQIMVVRLSFGADTYLADAIAIRTRESTTALSTVSRGLGLQVLKRENLDFALRTSLAACDSRPFVVRADHSLEWMRRDTRYNRER